MFTTNSQIVQQKYGAYPSAHASLQLWRLRRVASLPSGGDLLSLRGGKHRAEATAHAPSGRPHPHAATSKVTHRAVDRSVQRGYLEHSAVNSPGRVLVTPGATTVLSQLNPRNRLCDPPRAAASVARRVGGPSPRAGCASAAGLGRASAAGWRGGAFCAVIRGFDFPCQTSRGSTSPDSTQESAPGRFTAHPASRQQELSQVTF